MISNNFRCKSCGKLFFVSRYKQGFINGVYALIGEYQCYYCLSYDTEKLPDPKRNYNEGIASYAKFASATDEKKKEILTKRANAHYDKKGKEQKREYFKNAMNKMRM